jgi:hypothetical protein
MTNLENKKLISTSLDATNLADEIVALERNVKFTRQVPDTVGVLFAAYRGPLAVKDRGANSGRCFGPETFSLFTVSQIDSRLSMLLAVWL